MLHAGDDFLVMIIDGDANPWLAMNEVVTSMIGDEEFVRMMVASTYCHPA